MNRHLISLDDVTAADVEALFASAAALKAKRREGTAVTPLAGKTLALVFEKPSLRTRVTFEAGMTQLGGHAIYLAPADIRLGERETVQDAARNLERWVDGIVARTFSHQMVERLARYARVPVINGLTDLHHPVQILCDLFTLWEKRGALRGLTVAFVGDGNNVCHSWMQGAAKLGVHFVLACPPGYDADAAVAARAKQEAAATGSRIEVVRDPGAAVRGADVIYTDVWTSMGQEEERLRRLKDFQGYQVDARLVAQAKPDALVMHCLPAHRGEEIDEAWLAGPRSLVRRQAENRLPAAKAVLAAVVGARPSEAETEARAGPGKVRRPA